MGMHVQDHGTRHRFATVNSIPMLCTCKVQVRVLGRLQHFFVIVHRSAIALCRTSPSSYPIWKCVGAADHSPASKTLVPHFNCVLLGSE